ncbi:MAG: hypothetical protein ACYCQK_08020 [Acidiferrobacteraceae bacterium]
MEWTTQWERAQPWRPESGVHPPARPSMPKQGPSPVRVGPPRPALLVIGHGKPIRTGSFGIAAGSWIPARLIHGVSDADPGWAELRSTRSISGSKRSLPSGTLFFAEKRYNPQAGRMEFTLVEVVLRSGRTLPVQGLVFDRNRRPGLPALVLERPSRRGVGLLRWRHWLSSAIGSASARYGITRPAIGGDGHHGASRAGSRAYCNPQPAMIQVMKEF